MFGLPEDMEYIEDTDTGDKPFRRQDSQPTQLGKTSSSHILQAPEEEGENAHSWRLHQEDHTAQRSAATAEIIARSRRLGRDDQTAHRRAAATKKSSEVPPAAPAPTIGSRVTKSQVKNSAES